MKVDAPRSMPGLTLLVIQTVLLAIEKSVNPDFTFSSFDIFNIRSA
jgi:hypothetical protein